MSPQRPPVWHHAAVTVIAAADGSALGNPGPAGWGWFVDEQRWACGGWPRGTNNMGELTAVLDLLRQTATVDEDLLIYCDSTYVINSITKWMPGWKRKGWRKGDGQPVQNLEIMQALDTAMAGRRVRFEWVKGHAGHELNEAADRLANGAALAYSRGEAPDPGPGFSRVDATRTGSPVVATSAATGHAAGEYPTSTIEPQSEALFTLDEPPSDEEQVVILERSLLSDEVRGDRAAVAALLHPEWSEIGRSGRYWTRDEMLDAIGALADPVRLEVVSVAKVSTDSVLLVWRAVTAGRSTLRSSLWLRHRDSWRQRFHQGTDET
jgi:ribonuclease HI